jgi:hypothetical protein
MIFMPEMRPSSLSFLRITPSASVVAQHRQVALQRRRKKGVISLRLKQWQPSRGSRVGDNDDDDDDGDATGDGATGYDDDDDGDGG